MDEVVVTATSLALHKTPSPQTSDDSTTARHAQIVRLCAARLRERRIGAGLTQAELAERAGSTTTYVSRIEAAGSGPGIDTVSELAAALGTDLRDLLPDSQPPDERSVFKDRAEAIFAELMKKADVELLRSLVPSLARLLETPAKN